MTSARPVVLVNPANDLRPAVSGRTLAAAIAPGRRLRLALLSNGKPNGAELLDHIAMRLRSIEEVGEVRRYRKASVSVAPSESDSAEIRRWADAVITAIGD
jgi:hypothetical protein